MHLPENPPPRHRAVVMSQKAMVASAHPQASLTGIDVMRRGGNAFDAAIAINAVLNVTQPGMCGIGGDLFALVYSAKEKKVRFLNGSGRSPQGLDPKPYLGEQADAVPLRGIQSVSVPGCVDAWFELSRQYGSLPIKELLMPAIQLAEEGHPISHFMAAAIDSTAKQLNPHSSWLETYAPNKEGPRPGSIFRQPDLARTFRLLSEEGRDAFYQGPIAEAIVAISDELNGSFTLADFEEHSSYWGDPIKTTYREYTVYETPPNTQGLAALISLNIVEGFGLSEWGWFDPERHHRLIEGKKLAFVDRDRHIADPEFYQAPLDRLLSKEYAESLKDFIDPQRAGHFGDSQPNVGGTTYFAVADQEGNLISCVQSLFRGFGALVVPRGTGISLHNRGSYFSTDPNHPNALAPGKRPFHTLIASMAFQGDEPALVFGTMGGDGQPQTHLQVFSNLFDHGMDIQTAIEAPRWFHGPLEIGERADLLRLEARFPKAVFDRLSRMGHVVQKADLLDSCMGHAHGIWIEEGVYMGGADPRGDGAALGW